MFGAICTVLLYVAVFVWAILVFFRFWISTLAKPCTSYTCMVDKTVIVTGANTGCTSKTVKHNGHNYQRKNNISKIEYELNPTKALNVKILIRISCCRFGAVWEYIRNESKANEAKDSIIKKSKNSNVTIKLVNFQSIKSIRKFCTEINGTVDQIDVLVNNAGVLNLNVDSTEDGLNATWQTNYFGPYLLTNLLINKLKKSNSSRIINVASIASKYVNLSVDTLNQDSQYFCYMWTKQANILFSNELAKRLKGTKITVYAVHPGAIYTDIWQHMPKYFWWKPIIKFIYKTSEEGAQTSIYCSVAKECENDTGKLYAECEEIEMYNNCKDMKLALAVWEKTADLLKLGTNERI